ncbi:hypothetical protein [Spirosoma radiotolerans]|uniref:DUF1573 domain-containing protein n=1 Tax=Spirosoma radiotolerans TaxID=1379870 RepID=A0A0E3V7A9_9BACT|nr:hypothetical protein [Spirosoma radiotolerans]AKD55732.1 hypothetical protein SD10_13295 [Spirosoma radiotolerans]
MKQVMKKSLIAVLCSLCTVSFAQQKQPFSTCSAAFIDSKMIVNLFQPTGQCRLSPKASGELTVKTIALSSTESKPLNKIPFTVAIRDKATNTLHMYSRKPMCQIPVQRVLANCKKGDNIVLLTVSNRYALPHNEILVK